MQLLLAIFVVASAAALQDAPAPQSVAETGQRAECFRDKGIDDYIQDIKKMKTEARRRGRFSPTDVCIFGYCTGGGAPPGLPPEKPPAPSVAEDDPESTSRAREYEPLAAAHEAEVGDYYYGEKNYRAALVRYVEALRLKPGDAALHLRIGRALEKLAQPQPAYLAYDSTLKLEAKGKTLSEAQKGLARTGEMLRGAGTDVDALARDNRPEAAPCLSAPPPSR